MTHYFKVSTNKPPIDYKCGEEIIFTVDAKENNYPFPADFVRWELKTDDGVHLTGTDRCPITVKTSLSRPGFARLTCKAYDANNELTDMDVLEAGAGAEIEKLEYCGNIPNDYDEFWAEIKEMVDKHDTKAVKMEPVDPNAPGFKCFNLLDATPFVSRAVKVLKGCEGYKCYDVHISTPFGNSATGYLTYPEGRNDLPINVMFVGYSLFTPSPVFAKDCISLIIGAHGFENGMNIFDQAELHNSYNGYGFNEEENKNPKTSYWYSVMVRDMCALKFVKSLPQWNGKDLKIIGGSQGAFQAFNVTAHDDDVTFLSTSIPWFCNLNAEKNKYMAGWRPKAADGLEYFDTVAAARKIKCHTEITAYLGDYICPPSTVATLYNTLNCEKQIVFIQAGMHAYRPPVLECYTLMSGGNAVEVGKKYRHYKGNEYEVLFISTDSETAEKTVVYRSLTDGKVWTRPIYMWNEMVLSNGSFVKRFQPID